MALIKAIYFANYKKSCDKSDALKTAKLLLQQQQQQL